MTATSAGSLADKPPDIVEQKTIPVPDRRTGTPAWAGAGVTGGNTIMRRTFEQIIQDEQNQRNILEIQLIKIKNPDGTDANPKGLNYDDIGELLFDVLKINPEDCISFNFNTGRYDQREVKFKPNLHTLSYMRL